MQPLDPNRPHGLDDVIDRMNTEGSPYGSPHWLPSWADICRVREYVGAEWSGARDQRGNDYSLAFNVLVHLEIIAKARAAIAPYVTIACAPHAASVGVPCALQHHRIMFDYDLALPETPIVCTWRVLAKHDRLAALEIFERRRPAPERQVGARRNVLPISGGLGIASSSVEADVAIARVQHRHPQSLGAERIFVASASDWTIRDVWVDGASVLAPHRDLPGFLFSSDIMGPHLPLPVIAQDQWIEIEARRVRGDAPQFYASVIGSLTGEHQ